MLEDVQQGPLPQANSRGFPAAVTLGKVVKGTEFMEQSKFEKSLLARGNRPPVEREVH